jgi:hypothetical protein
MMEGSQNRIEMRRTRPKWQEVGIPVVKTSKKEQLKLEGSMMSLITSR